MPLERCGERNKSNERMMALGLETSLQEAHQQQNHLLLDSSQFSGHC
jgi:hypothetical protein